MKHPHNVAILLLLLCGVTAIGLAGGFQLNEHGARAMAQAGAFAARAYDASAIYFNPAGLGFQEKGSIYLGVTGITPKSSFYGPFQQNTNAKTDQVKNFFNPINAYVTSPVLVDGLHVGFGVYNPFGLGTEWPSTWAGKALNIKVDLKSFFFTPTVAYKLTDILSIGGGVSYATGNVVLDRSVITGFGESRIKIDLTGHGWGWDAGLLVKPVKRLSVGLTYRSQVKVEPTGSATFNPTFVVLTQRDASTTIKLPATGYAGIAYQVFDNLEVEADYQFIGWSSYKELAFRFKYADPSGKAIDTTIASPKNYNDTYIIRIGGQYTVDKTHIRFGYYYDHSPVDDQYTEPLLPDAHRNGLNVGLGYDFNEHFSADLAYLYLEFDPRKASKTIPDINFDGVYNSTIHLLGINVGYRF